MVLLPALILGSQIESARVLQVRWKHNGLVTGFPWELHAQVPGIESDEDKVKILGGQVLGSEGVEAVHGVSEGAGVSHMFPRQGGEARYSWGVHPRSAYQASIFLRRPGPSNQCDSLQRGVMGVLMGLTSTLSRCICQVVMSGSAAPTDRYIGNSSKHMEWDGGGKEKTKL